MNGTGKGLAFWRRQLATVQLPALSAPAAHEALLAPGLDLDSLLALLQADLPLALEIVVLAGREARIGGEVQGLQHAVTVLGADKVQALLRRRSAPGLDPTNAAHREAVRAMAASHLARCLLLNWTRSRGGVAAEYLEWLTLALGVARWKLPLAAPAISDEISRRAATGERRSHIEQSLLGCSITELNAAHLQDLGLPASPALARLAAEAGRMLAQASRYAWEGALAPELPVTLARYLHQRGAECMTAHLLAWAAEDSWYSGRTRALMRAAAAQTHQPLDALVASTRQAARCASLERAFAAHVPTPCERLFWPPPPPRPLSAPTAQAAAASAAPGPLAPRMTSAATITTVTQAGGDSRDGVSIVTTRRDRPLAAEAESASAAPPRPPASAFIGREPDTIVVEAFMRRCLNGAYRDLRELLADTTRTLEQGLGLARCLLFLKASNSDRLSCHFAHGFDPAADTRSMSAPATDDGLLARLFRHAAGSICIDPSRVAAARRQLPPELREHVRPTGLLLGAIHLRDRPVGVIWADGGEAVLTLDANRHAEFKHMIRHFGAEFSRLTQALRR